MKTLGWIFALILTSTFAFSQTDATREKEFNLKKGVAIDGYDPVSYFSNNPKEGKLELKSDYKGVTYFFSSAANLNKFRATPEKYEPAYGGWCAFAMGDSGEKVKIDPETFKIIDGKLFLFYNSWGNNTLTDWNKNETSLKSKADQNWKKIIP